MTALRLIAYAPNGASLGPLPEPAGVSASYVLNDLGALSLTYHPSAARSSLLGQPLEIATEVSTDGGLTWTEPDNGRFLYLRDGRDPIKTDDAFQVDAPAYLWRLQKALVGTAGLTEDGRREYVDSTPGGILGDLLIRAHSRGALSGLTPSAWSDVVDANGTPWPETHSISYEPGTNLLAVLQGMLESGWVDVRTRGRVLDLFVAKNPSGLGRDQSNTATPVSLRYGRDLTEAPFRRTWEGLADTAVVLGDENATVTRVNPAAVKPWGVQETFVTASGVTDAGTLSALGDANLEYTQDLRAEHTFGLSFGSAQFLPFRDYRPGDWVLAATNGTDAPARMRLRQITLSRDEDGTVSGNVVLNDRFLEADVLQARRIARITSGATQAGATGSPSGIGPDILAPNDPTGLGASSAAYVDNDGFIRSQITLNWNDVTTNADNTPTTDVDHYEVWARVPGQGDWWHAADTAVSQWTNSPYEPGQTWEFKVRAVDTAANVGNFSAVASTTTAADLTPPPPPSAPTAVSRLGTAQVLWDGKTSSAADMATTVLDWRYVTVHVSQVNNFTPTDANRVGELSGPGYVVAGPLAYGTTYYARLVAWDSSGNASAASAQVAVVVAPLVDVSNFPDTAMETLFARTGKFLDLSADNFAANLIEGAWIKAGAISADKLTIGARGTSILRNSYMEQADGAGLPENWAGIWGSGYTLSGETAAPLSGTRSLRSAFSGTGGDITLGDMGSEFPVVAGQKYYARVTVKAIQATNRDVYLTGRSVNNGSAGNSFSILDPNTTIQQLTGAGRVLSMTAGQVVTLEGYWTIPPGHVRANVGLQIDQTGGAGDAFIVDSLEVWPAATDAQVTEVSAGKLITGIIQATQRLVAGTLTGARAELNGVGFQAFAADGRKMFEVQANSGDTVIGNDAAIHMLLGAYANWWNGNISSAMLKFRYTGSGWGEGQLFAQYWTDAGTPMAALRMQSPYSGDPYANAAYLDLRNSGGAAPVQSSFYLRAGTGNITANTLVMGSGDGSSIDFRAWGPGFQFSDLSQISRLRLLPQTGYFTIRSADSNGNAQQIRLQGNQVVLETDGQDLIVDSTGTLLMGSFNRNVGIGFNNNSTLIGTWMMDAFRSIAASAFQVNSDPRVKKDAKRVSGALAAVRALQVYDYDMEGILPRKSGPPKMAMAEDPTKGPRPRPGVPQVVSERNRARGVMADEVQKVLPDAVNEDEAGRLTVSLYDLLATTMAGLQEVADEGDTLRETVRELSAEVARLKATQSPRRNQ